MRQGNNPRRGRGRSNSNNSGRRNANPRSQSFDSNGPDGRIRGNASQVCEKYQAQARDAQLAGNRILAESLLQHAEHYFRILNDSTDPHPTRPASSQDHAAASDGDGTSESDAPANAAEDRTEGRDGPRRPQRRPRVLEIETPEREAAAGSSEDLTEDKPVEAPRRRRVAAPRGDDDARDGAADKPRRVTRARVARKPAAKSKESDAQPDLLSDEAPAAGDAPGTEDKPVRRVRRRRVVAPKEPAADAPEKGSGSDKEKADA